MEFSNLTKIFSQEYYAIPDYQRDYEWGVAQNSTLIEDIFNIVKNPSNEFNHFIGAIVTIPFEEDNAVNKSIDLNSYSIDKESVKHVVDGQQRLTSISILMQALWNCIEQDTELTDQEKKKQDKFRNLLLGNDYNDNDDRAPKLILNGNTGSYYNSKILCTNNASSNLSYRGAKRAKAAFDLFTKAIKETKNEFLDDGICANSYEYYKKLSDVITKKILLVEIVCDESSNAFQVFDSLNGKGLDLTAADRIKNILLSWSPAGKGAQKWDSFVACVGEEYLTSFFVTLFFSSQGKRISKNKLPDEFKRCYKESASSDFDYFFNDLKIKGDVYGKLRTSSTTSKRINNLLDDIKQINSEQAFVLLFAVLDHYGQDLVDKSEYVSFVYALMNLLVRMQVCEKSTNKLDLIFTKCIDLINKGSASITVITKKLQDEMKLIASDAEFKASFEKFAPQDNSISEYYLRYIENYERKIQGDRTSADRNLTVEHIIPRTLGDLSEWYGDTSVPEDVNADFKNNVVERLGNKLLLFGDDNSSASNNDYLTKVDIYKNGKRGQDQGTPIGTFKMVSELLSKYPLKFNHDEVNDRSKLLSDYALKIWS